ncbi:GntR family transcriptional regulator [Amycolatopsis sp. NPDC102389]|uniref:GntR family transcriptional regulator n=1 Tax=Amycolatopsis sp. NPDC102389 TaxID=3363941 RepID=UPI00382EEB84
MDKLDPNDSRPPYVQVTERLRALIYGGTYGPGTKLPSLPNLVEQFGVSVGTIKRALGQLQDDQVIVTRQGQGSYVRASLPSLPAESSGDVAHMLDQLATIRQLVDSLERQLRAHG